MPLKLEEQTCSKESSMRLEQLGVPQESLFYYVEFNYGDNPNHWPGSVKPKNEYRLKFGRPNGQYINGIWQGGPLKYFSAFTASELGELLPTRFEVFKHDEGWDATDDHNLICYEIKNEAEARAKLLIYLLESGLCQLS